MGKKHEHHQSLIWVNINKAITLATYVNQFSWFWIHEVWNAEIKLLFPKIGRQSSTLYLTQYRLWLICSESYQQLRYYSCNCFFQSDIIWIFQTRGPRPVGRVPLPGPGLLATGPGERLTSSMCVCTRGQPHLRECCRVLSVCSPTQVSVAMSIVGVCSTTCASAHGPTKPSLLLPTSHPPPTPGRQPWKVGELCSRHRRIIKQDTLKHDSNSAPAALLTWGILTFSDRLDLITVNNL